MTDTDLPTTATPTNATAGRSTGKTVIHDSVISKIAGIAAREVTGVYALGGGAARAFGAIRNAISASDLSQGISIEVGEAEVAVDISLVAEYPVDLHKVAADVREAVITAIEGLAGMRVTAVNVTVNDVHIATDDDETEAESAPAEVRGS